MAPTPIVMCGKFAEHAANFSQLMLPEYEVIHHFQSTTEASTTLPAVMKGEPVISASGVGTNTGAIPQAMFVGGGFSDAELEEMLKIPEGKVMPWIAADPANKPRVQELGLEAAMAGIAKMAKGRLGKVVGVEEMKGMVTRY